MIGTLACDALVWPGPRELRRSVPEGATTTSFVEVAAAAIDVP